jgi:hypothetical protein
MNTYQRLIVHKVAEWFKLSHRVIDLPFAARHHQQLRADGTENQPHRMVVVSRTPESCIPERRLLDLFQEMNASIASGSGSGSGSAAASDSNTEGGSTSNVNRTEDVTSAVAKSVPPASGFKLMQRAKKGTTKQKSKSFYLIFFSF